MTEEEDVKRIEEVLLKCKTDQEESDLENYEYEDFIHYGGEPSDNEDADEDLYILPDLENVDISKFNSHSSSLSLKDDEKLVIHSCEDPELKHLLLLNRNKNIALMRTFKKLKDMLIECQENIKTKRDYIISLKKKKIRSTKSWKLATPYFKGKDLYPCPPNPDIIRKNKNKELFFYDMVPTFKWSQVEIHKLLKGIKINYHVNRQKSLLRQINELKNDPHIEDDADKAELMNELKQKYDELDKVEEYTEIPPLNSDEFINWDDISDQFFSRRFSGIECKTFWHVYAHPQINKAAWSREEKINLQYLAEKYNYQNWDRISEELYKNRTPFLTCLHYYSDMCSKFKKNIKFSVEEDKLLLQLVKDYRHGSVIPWAKVALHFADRNKAQVFYRYKYYLSNHKTKKGKFTEAEDVLLMVLVDRFGRNFVKCAEYFPHRSTIQLKARHTSNLIQPIRKGTFTLEDDEIILNHVKEHGETNWQIIVKKICRCRAQIVQRYRVLQDYLKDDPYKSLEEAPRRKHPKIAPEKDNYHFLRMVANKFTAQFIIPTIADIKKTLRQNRPVSEPPNPYESSDSSFDEEDENDSVWSAPIRHSFNNDSFTLTNVDELLTDFFAHTFEISQSHETDLLVAETTRCIRNVLDTLKVTLEIPDDFEHNSELDQLDLAVLSGLCSSVPNIDNCFVVGGHSVSTGSKITELIPCNVNTLVGLRSLLIKYVTRSDNSRHIFDPMNQDKRHKQMHWCITKHLSSLEPEDKILVSCEREMFFQRFLSLFKFPAIMSLQPPSKSLLDNPNTWKHKAPPEVKRTYSKKICNRITNNLQVTDQLVDHPELVRVVTSENDLKPPQMNALPVKILKGVMVKDIKTLKLGEDGRVRELQSLPVQNTKEAKTENSTEVALKPVTDKGIIKYLKQQIQQQLNDLSKEKNKKVRYKDQTVFRQPISNSLVNKTYQKVSCTTIEATPKVTSESVTEGGSNQQFETVLVNGDNVVKQEFQDSAAQNWRKKIACSPSKKTATAKKTPNNKTVNNLQNTGSTDPLEGPIEEVDKIIKPASSTYSQKNTKKLSLTSPELTDPLARPLEEVDKVIKPAISTYSRKRRKKPEELKKCTVTNIKVTSPELTDLLARPLEEVDKVIKPASSTYSRKRKKPEELKTCTVTNIKVTSPELTDPLARPLEEVDKVIKPASSTYSRKRRKKLSLTSPERCKRSKIEDEVQTSSWSSTVTPGSDINSSVFDVGKGELLVGEPNASEDIEDIMMLDAILKKERTEHSEDDISEYDM